MVARSVKKDRLDSEQLTGIESSLLSRLRPVFNDNLGSLVDVCLDDQKYDLRATPN